MPSRRRRVPAALRGTIKLPDGRVFPEYNGEALAWDYGLYMTTNEEQAGYPRARVVINELITEDPNRFCREVREMQKAQFGLFSGNARRALNLLRDVWNARPDKAAVACKVPGRQLGSARRRSKR